MTPRVGFSRLHTHATYWIHVDAFILLWPIDMINGPARKSASKFTNVKDTCLSEKDVFLSNLVSVKDLCQTQGPQAALQIGFWAFALALALTFLTKNLRPKSVTNL